MTGGTRIIARVGEAIDGEAIDGEAIEGEALDGGPAETGGRALPPNHAIDHAIGHDDRTDASVGIDRTFEPQGPLRWIVPGIAAALIIGWTVLLGVARAHSLQSGPSADGLVNLVTAWALPVLLVLMGVLIARTTLRDASRHAVVIHALAEESRLLEGRLRAMNTELSLARDFIAAQGRDLESLGRIAVDRLSGSAERLKDLIAGQGKDMDHIGTVAAKALENIGTLRAHLPVISNSAKDAANAIAHAGHTADAQLEELIGGFNRLNEFGTASGRKVEDVRAAVDAALDAFATATERIGVAGEVRLRAVIDELNGQRAQIDREEVAALAAIRARAETLAQELATQREVIASAEEGSLAALAARIAALDTDVRKVAAGLARAIEEVGRDHDQLVVDSRERLRRFEESAGSLGRALVDEAASLDDALGVRRHALEAALAATAEQFAARLDQLDTAIGQRRAAMAAAAADAADALDTRLAQIDRTIGTRRQQQAEALDRMVATCDTLAGRVATFATTIDAGAATGSHTTTVIDAALTMLTTRLDAAREALGGTDETIVDLTDAAVRLLELIEAASDHTRTQIPEALRSAIAGMDGVERRVVAVRDTLREAGDAGTVLTGAITTADDRLGTVRNAIAAIHATIETRANEQERRLAALRETLRAAQGESDTLTGSIERRLAGAIAELEAAAHKAGADLGSTTAAEISAMAARFGEETSAALARVVQGRGAQMIARLEDAMDNASSSARETALQMRDQLARIDELAGNLENRVNHIRERAEEQVDSDFARRTALITESLNSTAIDITRILSAEVSESAWASYLRGERGIFTRRAVSLLDTADARAVQQHYENDEEFRIHVNRYIHDFEAMLRQLLSTRDGNALGVTLLSSDMGKLYVALAQGIERLRT
jgi:Mg2+ and Co2+ transporter CorA